MLQSINIFIANSKLSIIIYYILQKTGLLNFLQGSCKFYVGSPAGSHLSKLVATPVVSIVRMSCHVFFGLSTGAISSTTNLVLYECPSHRRTGRGVRGGQLTPQFGQIYDIYSGKRQDICLTNCVTPNGTSIHLPEIHFG